MEAQRICIKFCVANGIKCCEVIKMLENAFHESAMKKSAVNTWYKRFEDGREETCDDVRAGRPSTSVTPVNVDAVKNLVLQDRRITVREIAEELDISQGSCETILTEHLHMRKVSAKFIPRLLNFEQKELRKEIALDCLNEVAADPGFIQRIITGDESWVYGYDIETKAQSSEWRTQSEGRPKKALQVRSKVKVLLTVFYDYNGIVHKEFLPPGKTVNKEYYKSVMIRLREAIRKKRPNLWRDQSWILHHDNAPAHASHLVSDFLAKNNTTVLAQPPYSPDLAPCDFFLFPKLKKSMKGHRYSTIEEIKAETLKVLYSIPNMAFQKSLEDWKSRWHKCIQSDGGYFEGDHLKYED